jgi:hypothetical protein
LSVTCDRFSLGTPVSSINKTDSHDITELLLKVALNSTNLNQPRICFARLDKYIGILLMEETGVPRENLSQVTDKLHHIMLYITSTPRHERCYTAFYWNIDLIRFVTYLLVPCFSFSLTCQSKMIITAIFTDFSTERRKYFDLWL